MVLAGVAGVLGAPSLVLAPSIGSVALSALSLLAAGLAMRSWLLATVGTRNTALAGAIAYMVAPYHLFDLYRRIDLADLVGYAVLPLVMLAMRRTADGWRWSVPLLAASFGGLVLAQPPLALLCSVTLLPVYALSCTRLPRRLVACVGSIALGVGLAAVGLVPALQLWPAWPANPLQRADNWLVLAPERWTDRATMRSLASIALALAVLFAGLCIALVQMPLADARRHPLGQWIAIGLAGLALVVGLVPAFWTLPFFAVLPFPWRLMMVVEFAAISALCLVPITRLRRVVIYFFAAAGVALVPAVVSMATDIVARARPVVPLAPEAWLALSPAPWAWTVSGLSLLLLAGLVIFAYRRPD